MHVADKAELTPQQLIATATKATTDAITDSLASRSASIALPMFDWDSKDAFRTFSLFWQTLDNWLFLNQVKTDSKDHLHYAFAALGTKALDLHAQRTPTGTNEEWKATKAKASAFLPRIQDGMTHEVNTHIWLTELEDVIAKPNEDPQELVTSIKTLMDRCEMINDAYRKHKLCRCIVHPYRTEARLLDKLMAKSFKTPSNELNDIAVNHFAIQWARKQVSNSTKLIDAIDRRDINLAEDEADLQDMDILIHNHRTLNVQTALNVISQVEPTARLRIRSVTIVTKMAIGSLNTEVENHH